jgi:squalene-associated FAD-dependent desaturase
MKTAVVGAGWAGLAAAVALRQAGHDVTVLEAGRTPGGRARRVLHDNFDLPLDNGQHILLGAYTQTLALMRSLGRDPDALFTRLPLSLASLDGAFRLVAPRLPAPLHAAAALVAARGLDWRARLDAIRLMRALRAARWQVPAGETVAALLQRHAQPAAAIRLLWEPLCVAALNTPVELACAQLYSHVLRDSLAGPRAASDLLLPRTDLSSLWPDAAADLCHMRYGATVRAVRPHEHGVDLDGEPYDAAVLAVAPAAAVRLLALPQDQPLARALLRFEAAPIATLYLRLAAPWRLPQPIMMLHEDLAAGQDGQWIFDRTQLAGDSGNGEIAIVVSAAQRFAERDRETATQALVEQVRLQAARGGRLPPLPQVQQAALLVDKRATFLATPALPRPANATPWPRLALAGDWTDTGYPGVLEGAVRSGRRAATVIAARAR